MAAPRKFFGNPDVEARVRQLHAQGLGRNAIAEHIGCADSTLSKITNHLGLTFDRTRTAEATKAKQIDAAARRAAIVERLYGQAEHILDRLEAPEHKLVEVSAGKAVRYKHDRLPPRDINALIASVGAATEKAVRLEKLDARDGAEDVASMLGKLGDALLSVADHVDSPSAPEQAGEVPTTEGGDGEP
ncbi:hypothetical protein [Nocardiopsis synnemataformans]|uniref:hypothetical protein n=1 Tax=Nocardiopsis synnemataformans TaxID=61305 RepID=UPI003EB88C3B